MRRSSRPYRLSFTKTAKLVLGWTLCIAAWVLGFLIARGAAVALGWGP